MSDMAEAGVFVCSKYLDFRAAPPSSAHPLQINRPATITRPSEKADLVW
jgi:hypothetical protein